VDNSICCSPPVPRWENDSWEKMFPPHLKNWPSELRYPVNLDYLAAFVRTLFERSGLVSVPRCPLSRAFHPLGHSPLISKRVTQARGARREFFIRAHWESWCGSGDEVPNL